MSSPRASFSHVLRASEGKREEGVWKAGSPRPPQGFAQRTPVLQAERGIFLIMWTQCCDCLTGLSCIFFEHLLRSKSGICRTPNWTWRIIAELSREKRSNMHKIWLSVHPRNFGSDKFVGRYVHPFTLTDVKCHTYQPVVEGPYNLY